MNLAALLLADPSPCLRALALRDLLGHSADDAEVQETAALRESDPLVAGLFDLQRADGSWVAIDPEAPGTGGALRMTALALTRLGYLGFGPEHRAVRRGAEFLLASQGVAGNWELAETDGENEAREGYTMVPLWTVIPLRGLAACGMAADSRVERAYEWLLAQRLADGAWPTGINSGVYGRVAGYRRLAHSTWGCRSNTTGALACLALHPERRTGPEARRALDLLLGRETREQYALGFEVARVIGAEPARGMFTFFARFDLAQVLDLCWRVGGTTVDQRVAGILEFVLGLRGRYGLWEYGSRPQVTRWVTFDILRSLSRIDAEGDWIGLEPRTPFSPYPRRLKRY